MLSAAICSVVLKSSSRAAQAASISAAVTSRAVKDTPSNRSVYRSSAASPFFRTSAITASTAAPTSASARMSRLRISSGRIVSQSKIRITGPSPP